MSTTAYPTPEAWQTDCPWEIVRDQETGAAVPCPPGWEALRPETRILLRQPAEPGRFA